MIGGNMTEKNNSNTDVEITPETYEKMNEEFVEQGLAFILEVPTQEEIDKWRKDD